MFDPALFLRFLPAPLARLLQARTMQQFIKFGLVGVAGLFVDIAFLYVGIDALGLSRVAAGYFSFPFAMTFTWIGNRLFTFRDIEHEPLAKQWTKFGSVCVVGLVFNRGTYTLLVQNVLFVHAHPFLGLCAGSVVGMFFNFIASKKLVFK